MEGEIAICNTGPDWCSLVTTMVGLDATWVVQQECDWGLSAEPQAGGMCWQHSLGIVARIMHANGGPTLQPSARKTRTMAAADRMLKV